MTFKTFAKRATWILAAFGFAALVRTVMNADAALVSHGFAALLPLAIVGILMVRIASKASAPSA